MYYSFKGLALPQACRITKKLHEKPNTPKYTKSKRYFVAKIGFNQFG